jgi:hypothetical protein
MDDLVILGKNWGWFDSDMKPLATGDNWHKLACPSQEYQWVEVEDYKGNVTQEQVELPCPIKSIAAKRDTCARCFRIFVYP